MPRLMIFFILLLCVSYSSSSKILLNQTEAKSTIKYTKGPRRSKHLRYYDSPITLQHVRERLPYMLMMDPIGPDHVDLIRKYDIYCAINKRNCYSFGIGLANFCNKVPHMCDPLGERFHFDNERAWQLARTKYWRNFLNCPFCQAETFLFDFVIGTTKPE